MVEGEKIYVPLVSRLRAYKLSDLRVEVDVGNLSGWDLIGCRQLNQIDRSAQRNYVVWPTRLAQSMVLLQLNHQMLCSNQGTWIPLVSKSNRASSRLMLPED